MFFLILGPSGVGKGSIITELKKKWEHTSQFFFPITATTRPARAGERDGKDYFFLSHEQFEQGIANNDFLEHAIVHKTHYYGLPKKQIIDAMGENKTVIRELDIQGLHNLQSVFSADQLFSLFILPPDIQTLEDRIRARSPLSEEEIATRMQTAKVELSYAHECNAQVISRQNFLMEAVDDVVKIIEQNK